MTNVEDGSPVTLEALAAELRAAWPEFDAQTGGAVIIVEYA